MPRPQDDDREPLDPTLSPPPPPTPAPKPAARHAEWVVEAAKDYGLSDEQIAAIPPAQLQAQVRQAQRREAALFAERMRQGQHQPAPAPQPAPAEPEVTIDWGEHELDGQKVKVTDDMVHPAVAKALRDAHKEIARLKKAGDDDRQARQQQTIKELLDDAIAHLNRPDLFGEGGMDDQTPGSPEAKRRVALVQAAEIDLNKMPGKISLRKRLGETAPVLWPSKPAPVGSKTEDTESEAGGYADALNGAGNGKPKKPAPANGHPTPEEWAEGGAGAPSHRKPMADTRGHGPAKAVARDALQKMGLKTDDRTLQSEDDQVFADLPP